MAPYRWYFLFSSSLLGVLTSCATPHPLTRGNEQPSGTQTMIYYNHLLDTHLQLYGDYELNLHPRNRVDALTKTHLKQLGLARRHVALLFTGRTYVTPTYVVRAMQVRAPANWLANGFHKTDNGGFLRATTAGTELVLEYAVALAPQPGWLYLLASAPAPTVQQAQADLLDTSLATRRRAMDDEFKHFIFPSIGAGRLHIEIRSVR